jgi:hypothetical protein
MLKIDDDHGWISTSIIAEIDKNMIVQGYFHIIPTGDKRAYGELHLRNFTMTTRSLWRTVQPTESFMNYPFGTGEGEGDSGRELRKIKQPIEPLPHYYDRPDSITNNPSDLEEKPVQPL